MTIEIQLHPRQEVERAIILRHSSTAAVGRIARRISRIKVQMEARFQPLALRLRTTIITIPLMALLITSKAQFSLKIT